MASLIDQLKDHREPTLLLYLANEFPPQHRADLERILTTDAALRHELESLRALQSQVMGGLADLDSSTPLHASEEISTRRIMREMRRLKLEMDAKAPAQLEPSTLRTWPRWIYPLAAAAAIIFIFLGLWGFGFIDITPAMPGPRAPAQNIDDDYMNYMNPGLAEMNPQDRLQSILLASFGVEDFDHLDHPLELEESEDPGALHTNG